MPSTGSQSSQARAMDVRQQRRPSCDRRLRGGAQVAARLDARELGALEQSVEHGGDLGPTHRLTDSADGPSSWRSSGQARSTAMPLRPITRASHVSLLSSPQNGPTYIGRMEQVRASAGARVGLVIAQVGGAAMIAGGVGDQLVRDLLPAHLALLGASGGSVSPQAASLVLALLHTVGYALIATGIATIALLRQLRSTGKPKFAVQAAVVALLAEGANAFHMHRLGIGLYVVPLGILVLVVAGTLLYVASPPARVD
ncbi:MAG: hypothetical protein JWN48_879 [Myxococcaceae bacterium]|nr:hypothetical protein [Myxococcaceae bacterium]